MTVELAHELVSKSTLSLDHVLAHLNIPHKVYRKAYPDTPVTPALAYAVQEADDSGMTGNQLMQEFSLTRSQLNYALYNNDATDIRPKQTVCTIDKVVEANVVRDLIDGQSQTDVAYKHGISQPTVHKIAKARNLLPGRKPRVVLSKPQKMDIAVRVQQGESVESLAKEYGIARDTIYKYLRSIQP